MNNGKKICEALKEVRLRVAQANDIDYAPAECHHEGDCLGTCPRCEQEVRHIENQLALRRAMGKAVRLVGVSAGIVALSSCQLISGGGQENGYMVPPEDELGGYISNDSTNSCVDSTQQARKTMVVSTDTVMMTLGEIGETDPQFRGGNKALESFIKENFNATAGNAEGKVVVTFTVEKDGSLSNAKVVRSLNTEADKEALRVVRLMPKWEPGIANGNRVAMEYTMPFVFKAQ